MYTNADLTQLVDDVVESSLKTDGVDQLWEEVFGLGKYIPTVRIQLFTSV